MRRRDFITLLGATAAWPSRAHAQQAAMPRIGFLMFAPSVEPYVSHFRQALRELGYIEGKNIQLDVRGSDDPKMIATYAAELVQQNVSVIAAARSVAVQAAKAATTRIPIVITQVPDAVATGIVASLAKPGGNVTGVQVNTVQTAGKTLEVLREIMPAARRVASLVDMSGGPLASYDAQEVERSGKPLGMDIHTVRLQDPGDMNAVVAALAKIRPQAALIQPSLGTRAADVLFSRHVPAVCPSSALASACLMTYSADLADIYRIGAGYVDRILKGAKPGDLPVQQPTKFELVINQKIARTLGVSVPQSVLVRASRVIE